MPRGGKRVRQYFSLVIVSVVVVAVFVVAFTASGQWPSPADLPFVFLCKYGHPSCGVARTEVWRTAVDSASWHGQNTNWTRSGGGSIHPTEWTGTGSCEGSNLYYVFLADPNAAAMMYDTLLRHVRRDANCSASYVITESQVLQLPSLAKVVVVLADPVGRLYREYCPLADVCDVGAFHASVSGSLPQAHECILNFSAQLCVLAKRQEPLYRGIYNVFIEDWLLRLSRDRVYVIRLEDLAANASKELYSAHAHLGFADDSVDKTAATAPGATKGDDRGQPTRPEFQASRAQWLKRDPMLSQTRVLLRDFYTPFNQILTHVLKDQKFQWHDIQENVFS